MDRKYDLQAAALGPVVSHSPAPPTPYWDCPCTTRPGLGLTPHTTTTGLTDWGEETDGSNGTVTGSSADIHQDDIDQGLRSKFHHHAAMDIDDLNMILEISKKLIKIS